MKDVVFQTIKEFLPNIRRNVPLKNHTTFRIGGLAKYFLVAQKKEQIIKALELAKKLNIPYFILGGGSNILASDKGFRGLVVKIENKKPAFKTKKVGSNFFVEAPAGVELQKLVQFSSQKSLSGLEWAGGLPGTFGGAIRGNAGAFGGETKDSIVKVLALDDKLKLRTLSNKACQFSYRNSLFKQKSWIVLSATVKLKKGNAKEIKKIIQSHINYRKERHPLDYPNAGSIFKNVDVKALSVQFQKEFADKVKQDPFPIVPSAWLVIGAGLKGKSVGQAQVSEKHSNYIINKGNAKAQDVLDLIDLKKKAIKEKYQVILEQEVQFLED